MNKYAFTAEDIAKWDTLTYGFQGPPLGKIKVDTEHKSNFFANCRAGSSKKSIIGKQGVDILPNYIRWLDLIIPILGIEDGVIKIYDRGDSHFHFLWTPIDGWAGNERINKMQAVMLVTEPWADYFLKRFFHFQDNFKELSFIECIELVCREIQIIKRDNIEFRYFTYRFPFGNTLLGVSYFNKDPMKGVKKYEYLSQYAGQKFPAFVHYKHQRELDNKQLISLHAYEQAFRSTLRSQYARLESKGKEGYKINFNNKFTLISDNIHIPKDCGCLRYYIDAGLSNICGHELIDFIFESPEELIEVVKSSKDVIISHLKSYGISKENHPLLKNIS